VVASPHLLLCHDDVGELMVLRRLLLDTPYVIHAARSAGQALALARKQALAAVVADDERLPDMTGAALLAEIERLQPDALRILIARPERGPALVQSAQARRYQLVVRPYFAKPVLASLSEHAARLQAPDALAETTQRTVNPFVEEPGDPTEEHELSPPPGRIEKRRIMLTLAELVEAKAGSSAGHGARVSALAAVLAREAGLAGEELEAIEDAGLVHDVGELALEPALLSRDRPLTSDEQRAVRTHVQSSYQIVRRAGLATQVLTAVKHHHERFDGSGYPVGLARTAIPVGARILAVADTWDALATDRPYRRAVPLGECVRTLAGLGGVQLDGQLVALFLERELYRLIDWTDPPRPGVKLL
jgi:response regulator RpfG family c-di-GMP phosphodiesterase